jgi:hypothetical protein
MVANSARNKHVAAQFLLAPIKAVLSTSVHAGFLLGLFFDPEDGSDMFLRNVG